MRHRAAGATGRTDGDGVGTARHVRDDAEDGGADEDPRFLPWWLLRMAAATYRILQADAPAPDPSAVRRFEALATGRPARDAAHGQLAIDTMSVLRRAEAVREELARVGGGPVLALGDDDALTVALAMEGVPEVHAVDIDPRVLAFLASAGERAGTAIATHRRDIFEEPLGPELARRFAVVVTDPFRSADDGLPFLAWGTAALRRDRPARLLFADHPDWNLEHRVLDDAAPALGLVPVTVRPDLHTYPLSANLFPALPGAAELLDVPVAWLAALADHTLAVSDLHTWATRAPAQDART